ncbi:MAG: SRPBCC family protein [Caulobacteraceae bacterium]|nr:SRPBCC family protein [Caulobacteraceae bacterium]
MALASVRRVVVSEEVALGAAQVWSVIGDFFGMKAWAPAVESEERQVEGDAEYRVLTLRDGQRFKERLLERGDYFYTYTLPRPGMSGYRSTVRAAPVADDQARIELDISFAPQPGADAEALEAGLRTFCAQNLKAMKRALTPRG